jgi:hypothetical protein
MTIGRLSFGIRHFGNKKIGFLYCPIKNDINKDKFILFLWVGKYGYIVLPRKEANSEG